MAPETQVRGLPRQQSRNTVLQSRGVDAALSRRRSRVRIPSGPRKVAVWRRKALLGKEKNIPITVLSSNGRIARCLRDGCGFEPRQDREKTRRRSVGRSGGLGPSGRRFEPCRLDKEHGGEVKRLRCLPVTQFGAGSTPVTSAIKK